MKRALILSLFMLVVGCQPGQSGNNNTTTPTPNQSQSNTFTMAEIAEHDSPEDCWFVVSGKVYDVTSFIDQHPGGDVIAKGCGRDATQFYETKDGSGVEHSETSKRILAGLQIGVLKN